MISNLPAGAVKATGFALLLCIAHPSQSFAQDSTPNEDGTVAESTPDDDSVRTVGRALTIPAGSQPPHKVSSIADDTLTGDWGGLRTRLADHGIDISGGYVSETFGVLRGGLRKGVTYTQQLNFGTDLDMEKLAGWRGAKFHFVINDRLGKSLSSEFIGNGYAVQDVYSFQYAKISELSYEQDFAEGKTNLRAGLFPVGTQFGQLEGACDFVNTAFCAHPRNFPTGSYWSGYPNPSWGAMLRSNVSPELRLQGAVFIDIPDSIEKRYGFNPLGGHVSGVILPFEMEYSPALRKGSTALPGSYKLGFYFDTSNVARMGRPGTVSNRWGVYANFNQVVSRSANQKRNLMVIGYVALNPRSGAMVTQTYIGGLIKTGTFRGRDRDTLGAAFVRTVLNRNLREAFVASAATPMPPAAPPVGESVAEITYGMQVRPWLVLRPSLQLILDTGAFYYEHRRNAMAGGLAVQAQF